MHCELCIMNYELPLGVPASRRAFRYIFFRYAPKGCRSNP